MTDTFTALEDLEKRDSNQIEHEDEDEKIHLAFRMIGRRTFCPFL